MKRATAPEYDRFKSIVTAILVLVLIIMLLRGCTTGFAQPIEVENTVVSNATDVGASEPTASSTVEVSSPSPAPPTVTATSALTITPTSIPSSPTPTIAAPSSTPGSTVTETPTTGQAMATPAAAGSSSCNTSVPSRLNVGQTARVVTRLNMRGDASISASLVQTNSTNTQVEIIGGPVCEPVGERAYLWWQIRLPGGTEGWSAEMQLNNASYFLEPVP